MKILPSGRYAVDTCPHQSTADHPVVRVLQLIEDSKHPEFAAHDGKWFTTGGSWHADTVARLNPAVAIAIDFGQGWHVPLEDMPELVAFAEEVRV